MAFTNDYFLRQIEQLTNLVGQLFLHKQPNPIQIEDEQGHVTEEGFLWLRLKRLLAEGQINGAEDLLWDAVDGEGDARLLPVAVWFYNALSKMGEDALTASGFTSDEVAQGWADICARYELDEWGASL